MKDERGWMFERYLSSYYGLARNQDVRRSYELLLKAYLPADRDSAILDIGPGRGELVSLLLERGYRRVEAVDISREVARTVAALGVRAQAVSDLPKFLAGRARRYDLITMFFVLEHVPPQRSLAVMRALYRSLRPGGRLLLLVNNAANPFDPCYRYIDLSHTTSFTEYSLAQLFGTAGWSRYSILPFERSPRPAVRAARALFRGLFYPVLRALARAEGIPPHKVLTPLLLAEGRR